MENITEVIITGYDFGMNTSGGYQEYVKVPSEWVVPLPKNMSLKESMIYGTAGLTAAISVYKLVIKGEVKPEDGEILVTGATEEIKKRFDQGETREINSFFDIYKKKIEDIDIQIENLKNSKKRLENLLDEFSYLEVDKII